MESRKRYTVRQRRLLMQRTQELGPTEHEEIFKILREYDIEHTQNSNGIFVNLSRVSDEIIERVQKFVDFCLDNKQDLDEYDKRLNECKLSQNYDKFLGVICAPPPPQEEATVARGIGVHLVQQQQLKRPQPQPPPPLFLSHHAPPSSSSSSSAAAASSSSTIDAVLGCGAGAGPVASFLDGISVERVSSSPCLASASVKRVMHSKFHLAKKKYGKRRVVDRRGTDAVDQNANELVPEAFLV